MTDVASISDSLDLLSDTVYAEQASRQLNDFVKKYGQFSVEKTQIHGLRQIARQQPKQVGDFADHQRKRAERRIRKTESDFWKLVAGLCNDSSTEWSVLKAAERYLPENLRKENIPAKQKGMSAEALAHLIALRQQRKEWLGHWVETHIPAFFERFCSHALYRMEQL